MFTTFGYDMKLSTRPHQSLRTIKASQNEIKNQVQKNVK